MDYDVLIRGGLIVDGSGKPAYHGDVALRDGKIAYAGPSGKIAGQWIQHRTALHLGQQAGRQQCQSAAEALSKSIHPFRVHPGQRQRGLGHGQRVLIPRAELCLRGVSQPIALVRLGLQRHRTKAQRPNASCGASHARRGSDRGTSKEGDAAPLKPGG